MPDDWNAAKRAQKDAEARWTKKHGNSFYGYKLHANTDRRWASSASMRPPRRTCMTASTSKTILDPGNTGRTIRAYSAYADRAREAELKRQGYRADRSNAHEGGDRLEGGRPQPDAAGEVAHRGMAPA